VAQSVVGLLHPGEMGSAVGAALRQRGHPVLWASADRSEATARRAAEAGLEDAGTVEELARRSDVILSICPPHAALDVARSVAGFAGVFVDANAIAPETAREVARIVGRCVDGGIVGSPPQPPETTHLYLSGPEAPSVAELFAGTAVDARVVSDEVGSASAVKVTYAAWTKGTAAMLLAIQELAEAEGVEATLLQEWRESIPELPDRLQRAERSADAKGWRWVGEMEEIAAAFGAHDLPEGFHQAAAEVYRRRSREWQPGARS
jgi:3-hydroxyisobutyrate dehydrogenase-like beta-hydroxyacid dehydrogenase